MSIYSLLKGHPVTFIQDEWIYADTLEPIVNNNRPCRRCGKKCTSQGYDACLGYLPNVINACCGHGDDRQAYVILENGKRLSLTRWREIYGNV